MLQLYSGFDFNFTEFLKDRYYMRHVYFFHQEEFYTLV